MSRFPLFLFALLLPFTGRAQEADDLGAQANQKKIQGDYKGSVEAFTEAIKQNPKDVRAYLGRASAFSLQGDYDGAIADDSAAIQLDPKNAVAFCNRGNARAGRHDFSGAVADYSQALALDPKHARAYLNRGTVRSQLKDFNAAIGDYSAAITLDPKNGVAYYDRAGAKRATGDLDGALADYARAVELNPTDAYAWLNCAVLRIARRDWDGAATDLRHCLALVPEERQSYARIYLWVVGMHRGEGPKATQALQRHLDRGSPAFAGTWAWQIESFLAGKVDEAHFLASAADFEAKKNRGQSAQACYYAGLKRALAGDQAGAAKFFNQCAATGNQALHEFILSREELKQTGTPTP